MLTQEQTNKTVTDAVGYLDRVRRRQVRKLAGIRGLWIGLALLLVFFYLDTVLSLSGRQRLVFDAIAALAVIVTWIVTVLYLNRARSRTKMLARLVEAEHPELNNELVNALDFEERIEARNTGAASVALMQTGIERALESFDSLEVLEGLKPPGLRGESRVLLGVLSVWVGCGLFLSAWLFAELPRFIQPWADHPPYCPTKLIVLPAGAIVDYGKDLEVNVTARGRQPDEVWLVVTDPAGTVLNRVGMFTNEEGAYHQTIEKIRSNLTYYASVGRGRSKYYQIQLSKTPRIESVEVLYHYPEYAQLPERMSVLSDRVRELKGYKGTEVTLTVSSNRPLKGGVVTTDKHSYAGTAHAENSVQVVFPLTEPGPFEVAVTDVEGNVSTDQFAGRITLAPDGEPMISIVSPGMQSLAIPTAKIPIVIEAHDDLGIQRISLYRNHNESDDAHKLLYDANEVETFVNVVQPLDLADLGVRPGDVIDYYATATDSLPSAPQTAASEAYSIQIISAEQYADMMRNQMTAKDLRIKYDNILGQLDALLEEQQQLEQETRELRQRLQDSNDVAAAQAVQKQLEALAQRQDELAQKTRDTSAQLREESEQPPAFDIEKDYKKALAEFADHLDRAAAHMNTGTQRMEAGVRTPETRPESLQEANQAQKLALAELGDQSQETRDKIRQANRELEKMIHLLADVETFKQLYNAQKQLTRQTKSLRQTEADDFDTKVRFKELAERETATKTALEQLREDLRRHGDAVRQEYPDVCADAHHIADDISARAIPRLMQQGAEHLNQGSGPQAYPPVLEALEQMEAMISFCESAGAGGGSQCKFRLQIKMGLNAGDTLAQLSQGMGAGMGMGTMGAFGRGASGFGGGQSNMAVFGNDTFGQNTMQSSLAGAGNKDVDATTVPDAPNPLAGNIEELMPQAKQQMEQEVEGEGRMMAEYRRLIEAYFQRLAEDE